MLKRRHEELLKARQGPIVAGGQSSKFNFAGVCDHAHYILYNLVYFKGLILGVLAYPRILDPSKISRYTVS